jgi:ATP-dependent DNA ligase
MLALAEVIEPTNVPKLVASDEWVMEQKVDGHRVLIQSTEAGIRFLGRNGARYTKGVPASFAKLPLPVGWGIDGEILDGTFWAFDVVNPDLAVDRVTLTERRRLLAFLVEELGHEQIKLLPQASTLEDKEQLLRAVVQNGHEGVVFKKKNAGYHQGRSSSWLKFKVEPTADLVVSTVRADGKESAEVAYVRDGVPTTVGKVSLIGRPPVSVGDVIEVKYLYITDDGRLYQPRMVRKRTDKTPHECDGYELRATNKSVLETI